MWDIFIQCLIKNSNILENLTTSAIIIGFALFCLESFKKADINIVNTNGESAFDIAPKASNKNVANYLSTIK